MMRERNVLIGLAICVCVATLAFAVLFAASSATRPRPAPVEGTDRPDWLPVEATEIFHRSQEGFGWWKAAEFTIRESDFRAHAAAKGWTLEEKTDAQRPTDTRLLRPAGRKAVAEDFAPIPRALVYQKLHRNNGGVMVAFDRDTSRAYFSESHR